jgi:predicted deacylase
MSSSSSSKLSHFVVGLWVASILLGLGVFALWLGRSPSARSAILHFSPTPTKTFTSSFTSTSSITLTPSPGRTASSTRTFTPSLTSTATQTPIPFSEGPIKIGESVKGLPLEVYRYGTGPVERLIVAGMHGGGEYNTVQLVEELMAYLDDHPEIVPQEVTLYFLHALNPDGIARSLSYLGRANANGVDLNRNWPDGWKKDWDRTGCWITTYVTGGKKPASEPETQALMAFIQAHHFSGLINYHSAALGIFPGGVPSTDGSKQLAEVIAAVSTYHYPPIDTGCEYTGGMVDWTADQGIPSVDVELSDHLHTDFDMNLRILQVFLTWQEKPDQ